jgi:pyruvate/2-oxoglutarate dehydrogenase complex dihydrolipoamide acyltransferase (E2) component
MQEQNRDAIAVDLVVEATDGGYLSKIIVREGSLVEPGTVLAYIAENINDLAHLNNNSTADFESCQDYLWQAYLKYPPKTPTCS